MSQSKTLAIASLCALGLAVVLMRSTYPDTDWSPYYKVEVLPYESRENQNLGSKIMVDNLRIQDALNFSPALRQSPLWPWFPYYQLPYHFTRPAKVLVLGAGSGNEAIVALMHGAPRGACRRNRSGHRLVGVFIAS
ncbi:MAG TPA: hypothetical protein VGK57_18780 [Candidatus Binatia bacterium]